MGVFVLYFFQLGDNLIRLVKIMYDSPASAVFTNAFREFQFREGHQAVTLLSPLLFAVGIKSIADNKGDVTLKVFQKNVLNISQKLLFHAFCFI